MKKSISKTLAAFALTASFLVSAALFDVYADKKIGFAVGGVSVITTGGVETPAQPGALLKEGDKVRTAEKSRVQIIDGETNIWLRENSEVEIKPAPRNESIFSLIAGKIRAKVKLLQGSKFQVNSPVAVASVRGTDFSFDSSGQLVVFEGTVDFADVKLAQTAPVEAGNIAAILENGSIKKEMLTPDQVAAHDKDWQEIIAAPTEEGKTIIEGEGKDLAKKKDEKIEKIKDEIASEMLQMRREIRDMVREIRNDVVVTRDLTNEIKQSDFASGRTLLDRFGNLVRVEQQLLRPQNDTIQLVNITKRDTYKYNGFFGANTYQGSSSNRVDIAEAKLKFNQALPNDITEWPGFFSDKGDEVKIDKITLTMGNSKDKVEIESNRETVTKTDTYTWYDWDGTPHTNTNTYTEEEMKSKMRIYTKGARWDVDTDYDSRLWGPIYPDPDKDESINELAMWAKSPDAKIINPDTGAVKYISIWTENYGINNSGNLLSKDTFANSSENPFVLLKDVAFQTVMFVKELNNPSGYAPETDVTKAVKSDFFEGRNIDIVMTPDLFISVATKLMSKLGDIKTTSSNAPSFRSIGLLPL